MKPCYGCGEPTWDIDPGTGYPFCAKCRDFALYYFGSPSAEAVPTEGHISQHKPNLSKLGPPSTPMRPEDVLKQIDYIFNQYQKAYQDFVRPYVALYLCLMREQERKEQDTFWTPERLRMLQRLNEGSI